MEKSPLIEKSPEIKSYQFETIFSGSDFIQKSPIIVENAWNQHVYDYGKTMEKMRLDIKNTRW